MEFNRLIGEKNNMSHRIDIITSDGTKDNVNVDVSFQNFNLLPTSTGSSITQSGRLLSLDIFRGLTVVLMIFVEYAGGICPSVNHSPWNGITLADFVMPFFLFIVGVSLALAYKNLSCRLIATRKAIYRGIKLFIIGLFLQGGNFHGFGDLTYGVDIVNIRWMGILQRIAISFLVASICEIWLQATNFRVNSGRSLLKKHRLQCAMTIMVTVIYLLLFYGLYVPDWEYQISSSKTEIFSVKCGVRGDTGPACNAVGMINRKILGIQHLYTRPIYGRLKECSVNSPSNGPLPPNAPSWCQAPFDPEGLLSSLMAIVTCFIGLHYGHVIVNFKDHKHRIQQWLIPSSSLVLLGVICEYCFGMHLNKALYSFSYMCVTAGAAGFLFTAVYVMVDVWGGYSKYWTIVLKWMGKNALLIYVLVSCNILPVILQGFYWKRPENNILRLIGIGH